MINNFDFFFVCFSFADDPGGGGKSRSRSKPSHSDQQSSTKSATVAATAATTTNQMGQLSDKIQAQLNDGPSTPIAPLAFNYDPLDSLNCYNANNRLLLAQTAPMLNSGGGSGGGAGTAPSSLADKYLHKKFKRLATAHTMLFGATSAMPAPDDSMSTTSSIRSDSSLGAEYDATRRMQSYATSSSRMSMSSDTTLPWNGGTLTVSGNATLAMAARSPPLQVNSQFEALLENDRNRMMAARVANPLRSPYDLSNHHAFLPNNHYQPNLPPALHLQHREPPPQAYRTSPFATHKNMFRAAEDEDVVVVDDMADDDRLGNAAMELYKRTAATAAAMAKEAPKSLYQQSIMMRQQQQHLHQMHTNKTGVEMPHRPALDTIVHNNQPILISSSSSTEDIHLLQHSKRPTKSAATTTTAANSRSDASKAPTPGKHVCPFCQLNCTKPSVLRKHIRAHTNERPYPCKPCGFAFKTRSNLYKHHR